MDCVIIDEYANRCWLSGVSCRHYGVRDRLLGGIGGKFIVRLHLDNAVDDSGN